MDRRSPKQPTMYPQRYACPVCHAKLVTNPVGRHKDPTTGTTCRGTGSYGVAA